MRISLKSLWERITPLPSSEERKSSMNEALCARDKVIAQVKQASNLTEQLRTTRRNNGFSQAMQRNFKGKD